MIEHDTNSPFIRASSIEEPQTEAVYAVEVKYDGVPTEYWDVSPRPHSDEKVRSIGQTAFRVAKDSGKRILTVAAVTRKMTISATPWVEV